MSRVEELIQHVRKYWMMAGTSSPQFVMITTPLCCAVGIACVPTIALHYYFLVYTCVNNYGGAAFLDFGSDYEWSIVVIVIIQSIAILVGIIAPLFRCFAALSFKLSLKWVKKHTKVCEVEKYWTQKLSEWKQIPLAFPLSGRISKALVYNLYHLILNLCIICQKVIVASCKIIVLIPLGTVIISVFCVNCCKSLKANFFLMRIASNRDTNRDDGYYVLQLQDEMELAVACFTNLPRVIVMKCQEDAIEKREASVGAAAELLGSTKKIEDEMELAEMTVKGISNSMNRLIQKVNKEQHNDLLELLGKSIGFEGVEEFDIDQVQPLLSVEPVNSWSLPIVTLTCIAVSLPNIREGKVERLLKGVGPLVTVSRTPILWKKASMVAVNMRMFEGQQVTYGTRLKTTTSGWGSL
ncbi:uncharacterized protein LOC112528554 [Cynara cardunculus var. scolymus]|uniref:uncharacterized protein LOC112528554 n=1 Tax=Cynara cardunculus var. scolymus TaxID=59895 RepID=UPI000D62825D|nr:uncharacterized protein LOC112528554 [Cynara cardunculus var. scolymus]